MAAVASERRWFLGSEVVTAVRHAAGEDGMSAIVCRAARGDAPPVHVHSTEDELFHVLDGELRLWVDGEERTLRPGETALAPKGVVHGYRVESEEARWLVVTTRGDFERFVDAVSRPAEHDALPPLAPPAPAAVERVTAVARAHGIEIVGPPLG